jgi:hypothetical protein
MPVRQKKNLVSIVACADVVKTPSSGSKTQHGIKGRTEYETCLPANKTLSISATSLALYYFITLDGIPKEIKRRDARIKNKSATSILMSTFSFDAVNANSEAASCGAGFHDSEFHKSNSVIHYSEKNKKLFFSFSEIKK